MTISYKTSLPNYTIPFHAKPNQNNQLLKQFNQLHNQLNHLIGASSGIVGASGNIVPSGLVLPYGLVVGNAILDWDVDYTGPGVDGYGWRRIFDAEQCCLECLQVQGCSHWTTVPVGGEGHGCWLKT